MNIEMCHAKVLALGQYRTHSTTGKPAGVLQVPGDLTELEGELWASIVGGHASRGPKADHWREAEREANIDYLFKLDLNDKINKVVGALGGASAVFVLPWEKTGTEKYIDKNYPKTPLVP
jgi:hypothetical protein